MSAESKNFSGVAGKKITVGGLNIVIVAIFSSVIALSSKIKTNAVTKSYSVN